MDLPGAVVMVVAVGLLKLGISAYICYRIALMKNRSEIAWAAVGAVLGIVGILAAVIATPLAGPSEDDGFRLGSS